MLALAATTFAASGCGSSSKESSKPTSNEAAQSTTAAAPASPSIKLASGKPLTEAQWIVKGDAICARLNAQLAANPVQKTKTFAIVLPQAAAEERAAALAMAKLVPPSSKTADWQAIVAKTQQWAENSATLGRAAQTGTLNLQNPLVQQTTKVRSEAMRIAKRNGFKRCSGYSS
jgi:hypothetical protein